PVDKDERRFGIHLVVFAHKGEPRPARPHVHILAVAPFGADHFAAPKGAGPPPKEAAVTGVWPALGRRGADRELPVDHVLDPGSKLERPVTLVGVEGDDPDRPLLLELGLAGG